MKFNSMGKNKSTGRKAAIIRIIVQALLLDILAFTIILPLFPRLMDFYDKNDGENPVYF
jgi:hypothetical protein